MATRAHKPSGTSPPFFVYVLLSLLRGVSVGTNGESQLSAAFDAVGSAIVQLYDAVGWIIPAVLLTLLFLAILCAIGAALGALLGDAAEDLLTELPFECAFEGAAEIVNAVRNGSRDAKAAPGAYGNGRTTERICKGLDEKTR
jgi:hypothetical protein